MKFLVLLISIASVALAENRVTRQAPNGGFGFNPNNGGNNYPGQFDPYNNQIGQYNPQRSLNQYNPYQQFNPQQQYPGFGNRFGQQGGHIQTNPGVHQSGPFFRILNQYSDSQPSSYKYSYKTENQIDAEEEGIIDENDQYSDERGVGTSARGHYEYVDPEGNLRRVDYVADQNGYRAKTSINGQYEGAFPGNANAGQGGLGSRFGGAPFAEQGRPGFGPYGPNAGGPGSFNPYQQQRGPLNRNFGPSGPTPFGPSGAPPSQGFGPSSPAPQGGFPIKK